MDTIDFKQITLNKRSLLFPAQIEQVFLLERLSSKLVFFKTGLAAFCCLNLFLQYFIFKSFALIPSLLLIPLPTMILYLKFYPHEDKIDLLCCLSLFFMSLAVLSTMIYLPGTLSNFPVLFFLMISGFVLFKIRYLFIGLTGFFLTLTFGICLVFLTDVTPVFVFLNTLFLLFATIIGVAAAYTIEYYSRMVFLKSSILEQTLKETKKSESNWNNELIQANKSLELEIRAHTEAESQLKESEEKYRNLVISLPEGIFIVQHNKIVFLNPSMEKFTGYRAEELLGANADIFFTKTKHRANKKDFIDSFARQDGQIIFIEKSFVQIMYGSEPALLFSVRDITEKVNAAQDQKQLKKKLESAKKMEAFGILAGGVAHDLNNVLAGLISGPEALLMDLPKDSPLTVHVETIKESGRRALDIAQELLTLVRGSAKVLSPVRFNDVVEDYLLSPEFHTLIDNYPNVMIEKKLDIDLPLVDASTIHIRKVVMNLVSNAVEAAENDKGTVLIHTCLVEFCNQRIKGYEKIKKGKFIKFCVMNTGKGISDNDIEHIFEPFYSKKVLGRSGTGLGLSIVWNAVHDHNGYVHVSSKNNKTYFTLYFPISLSDQAVVQLPSQVYTLEDYSGDNEKVLVVDDMPEQQTIAKNMLKRLGYKVRVVSSGQKAIEYVRQNRVDLVLLDLVMGPGLNGYETYEQLILIDPKIKAIITSGCLDEGDIEKLQSLELDEFVQKPYSLETLGFTIKKELSGRKF